MGSSFNPTSALGFALALPSTATRYTTALKATLSLRPQKPKVRLCDNGRKFEAGFAHPPVAHGIGRRDNYPSNTNPIAKSGGLILHDLDLEPTNGDILS